MSKAAVASTVGKQAVEKGRPVLKKSIELIQENEEEIKKAHKILKETGAYEKMLEETLDHFDEGEDVKEVMNKFKAMEMEELKDLEIGIQEIQTIIENEEQVYQYVERVISIIANLEQSHESEEKDINAHIQKFKETRNAEHLEAAFKEEIDSIETLHEEAELATDVTEIIERAIHQVEEIKELEEIESEEVAEQESIYRKEGELFMSGEQDFLNEVKTDQQKEHDQIDKERSETRKIVKLNSKELNQLEEELKRMLEEAKTDKENVGRIINSYKESSMNFQDGDRLIQRLNEAESMLEQDIEKIEEALNVINQEVS